MSQRLDGKQEDDGIDLVQEVLAENPPEERGEREEWAEHVGWHRKEDIHKRASLRGAFNAAADANGSNAVEEDKNASIATKSDTKFWNERQTIIRAGCGVISLTCLLVFFRKMFRLSSAGRRRSKTR